MSADQADWVMRVAEEKAVELQKQHMIGVK